MTTPRPPASTWTPPPNWPKPEPGWTPPPGWQPLPQWGPAPAGWNFWPHGAPPPPTSSGFATQASTDAQRRKEALTKLQATPGWAAGPIGGPRKSRTAPATVDWTQVLFRGTSHDRGRNAQVTLYPDRLERIKAAKRSSLSRARQDTEVTPVKAISSVQAKKDGLLFTKVTAYASGNNIVFRFGHDEAQRFKDALMNLVLNGTPAPSAGGAPVHAPPPDIMDQLRKLGELRDAGILSEQEFTAKKTDLLGRL